jgi:hypothetical protein
VIGEMQMSGSNKKRSRGFTDKLASLLSAFYGRLEILAHRSMEILTAFSERFVEGFMAMTGQISETAITGLAVSTAYDVVYEIIKKQWTGTPEEQADFRQRAQEASDHLTRAGQILDSLQEELKQRNQELEGLLAEIEIKQADAERWRQVASVNEQLASALTAEIEERVRTQIRAELDKGKNRRRVFAVINWIITLILGGVVGAVIQQWWQTGRFFP